MYMSACLMYENIEAQLLQEKEGIHLILYSRETDIALSFSYPQMKVLADGCAALLAKLSLEAFVQSNNQDLHGALQLKAGITEKPVDEPSQFIQEQALTAGAPKHRLKGQAAPAAV